MTSFQRKWTQNTIRIFPPVIFHILASSWIIEVEKIQGTLFYHTNGVHGEVGYSARPVAAQLHVGTVPDKEEKQVLFYNAPPMEWEEQPLREGAAQKEASSLAKCCLEVQPTPFAFH